MDSRGGGGARMDRHGWGGARMDHHVGLELEWMSW
jgi:hypothetical protein